MGTLEGLHGRCSVQFAATLPHLLTGIAVRGFKVQPWPHLTNHTFLPYAAAAEHALPPRRAARIEPMVIRARHQDGC